MWLQETQEAGGVAFADALGSPGYVASARLSHTLDRIPLGLLAERDVGFTTGLGRPTIRDRATASIGTQTARWNLIGHFGFARNHPLSTAGASPGFSSSDAIDTWTTSLAATRRRGRRMPVEHSQQTASVVLDAAGQLIPAVPYAGAAQSGSVEVVLNDDRQQVGMRSGLHRAPLPVSITRTVSNMIVTSKAIELCLM